MNLIKRLFREEEGQGLVEYAILIGIIVVGVVAVVFGIGRWVNDQFTELENELITST